MSSIPPETEKSTDKELWFLNYYRCPNCQIEWTDEWSCQGNDKCPSCNKEITPYESEEIDSKFPSD
jgi:transcription initiation factor IIE alpha subunit